MRKINSNLSEISSVNELAMDIAELKVTKQDKLIGTQVEGQNIKTINNQSILGSGNITTDGSVWGNITGNINNQTDLSNALSGKENTISDLSTIRSGAALGASSVQPATLNNYSTTSQMNNAINSHHDSTKQNNLESGVNIKTINNQSILGQGDIQITSGVSSVNGKTGVVTLNASDVGATTETYVNTQVATKQDTLVSGTNIKTINNQSVLGGGNLEIGGLPTPTESGVAMIYDGTQWTQQEGYGYFTPGTGTSIDWDGQVGTRESFTASFYGEMDGTFVKLYDTPKTHEELKGGGYTFYVMQDVSETLGDNNYVEKEGLIETFSWVPDDARGYVYSEYALPVILIFPTSFVHNDQQVSPGIYSYNLMNIYYLKNLHWGIQDATTLIDEKFTFGKGKNAGDARIFNGNDWGTSKDFGYSKEVAESLVANINWDGDTTSKTCVGDKYYKVSTDTSYTGKDLTGKIVYGIRDGEEFDVDLNVSEASDYTVMSYNNHTWAVIIYQPGTYTVSYGESLTFTETGIYFLKEGSDSTLCRTIKIAIPKHTSYTGFKPDYMGYKFKSSSESLGFGYTTPSVSGNITWDGNTEGRAGFENYCKVSDKNVYNVHALVGGTAKYFDGTNTQTVTITESMVYDYGYDGSVEVTDDLCIECVYEKNPNLPILEVGIYFQKDGDQYISSLYYNSDGYVNKIAAKYVDTPSPNDFLAKTNPSGNGTFSMNRAYGSDVGVNSTALGNSCTASGTNSVAQNWYTIANGLNQTVIGRYNEANENQAFIIGNGGTALRSNALTVDWNGNLWARGNIQAAVLTDGTNSKTMSSILSGNLFYATYGGTTYSSVISAINSNKCVICKYFISSNDTKYIPLVYVDSSTLMFYGSWWEYSINKPKNIRITLTSSNSWTQVTQVDASNALQTDGSNVMGTGIKIENATTEGYKNLLRYEDGYYVEHDIVGYDMDKGVTLGNSSNSLNLSTGSVNVYHNKNNSLKKMYDEGNLTFSFDSSTGTLSITQT